MMLYALAIPGAVFVVVFLMMIRAENRCVRRNEAAIKAMAHYNLPERMIPIRSHMPRTVASRKPARPSIG